MHVIAVPALGTDSTVVGADSPVPRLLQRLEVPLCLKSDMGGPLPALPASLLELTVDGGGAQLAELLVMELLCSTPQLTHLTLRNHMCAFECPLALRM